MTDCNNANCVLELYLSRAVAISLSFQFEGTYGCRTVAVVPGVLGPVVVQLCIHCLTCVLKLSSPSGNLSSETNNSFSRENFLLVKGFYC